MSQTFGSLASRMEFDRSAAGVTPSLPEDAIQHYWREGYVVVRAVLDAQDIATLRTACDDLCVMARDFSADAFLGVTFFNMFRDADPFAQDIDQVPVRPGMIRRVTYPYACHPTFNAYRTDPRLLAAVSSLLGPDVAQVVNQVNFNHPGGSAGWGWHQDYRFRKPGIVDPRTDFVQTLLALDPCSAYTGGLRVIPRSFALGGLALDKEPDTAEKHFDAATAVTPEMEPGDVIFFNPLMIHGSTANRSPFQRRVYINGYARADIPFGMKVLDKSMRITEAHGRMEYEGDVKIIPKASKY